MITFETISYFRERLQALSNFKRGVYSGAEAEIRMAFKDVTIEKVRQNRDMILMQDDSIAVKCDCQTIVSVSPKKTYTC